ncbi:hypothetical protein VTL71DRAFT_6641 [Oculimacula yallundae]|uniref:Uncharacterized protein n=1 Tax=Oculimacula yallundae TaxID=86028 RepID=A0ABR4BXP1_9HELO
MAVINAITLGLGGLMSIPLLQSLFPEPEAQNTVVRFTNGALNKTSGPHYDGDGPMPNVALFNVNGGRVGFLSGAHQGNWDRAQTKKVTVEPINRLNNEVPEYISVSARSSNAICIAYIAVTGPNQEYWTWNGEFGVHCGQTFYYSNQPMFGTTTRPPCIWFSTDDRFPTGMALHAIDFQSMGSAAANNRGNQFVQNRASLCDSVPRQHFYQGEFSELNCIPVFDPLPEVTPDNVDADPAQAITKGTLACEPGPGIKPSAEQILRLRQMTASSRGIMTPTYGVKKRSILQDEESELHTLQERSISPRSPCEENHLVVSNYEGHSARKLCENVNSMGPDFVSRTEQLFCDMCTRTVWPLCAKVASVNCFDMDKSKLRVSQITRRSDGSTSVVVEEQKDYSDGMTVWE